MPTFVQFALCSDLFSKYENNCIKVGIAFQQLSKNDLKTILLIKNTYFTKNLAICTTMYFIPYSFCILRWRLQKAERFVSQSHKMSDTAEILSSPFH